jgi:hypothetical protein
MENSDGGQVRGPVLQIEFGIHFGDLEDARTRVAACQRRYTAKLAAS